MTIEYAVIAECSMLNGDARDAKTMTDREYLRVQMAQPGTSAGMSTPAAVTRRLAIMESIGELLDARAVY
jgi:hypothetical protein